MRKLFLIIIFFSFLFLMNGLVWADYQKTKIAVLDFDMKGKGYSTADMSQIVSEWLITALVKEGRFEVIERQLLQKVVGEQKLAGSGIIDSESVVKLGKILGVKVIITGAVIKYEDILEVNARIIDVESASIIAAENARAQTTTALYDLIGQMAKKIIKNFPLEGYVVYRKDNLVMIDLGVVAGAKVNMLFEVYKEGDIIKHPKTGEVLSVKRIHLGNIKTTKVENKIADAAILSEASPGSINYGQMVRSITEPIEVVKKDIAKVATKPVQKNEFVEQAVQRNVAAEKKKPKQKTKDNVKENVYRLGLLPSVSTGSKGGEIAHDGRFIAYDNGTVLDTKTNLMWAAKDDGKGLFENAAKDYIAKYRGGGHTDWRMPTMDELKTIYDWDMKNQHGYHVTKLIDITDKWVWGSGGWSNLNRFNFYEGSPAVGGNIDEHDNFYDGANIAQALPVRSGRGIYPPDRDKK